MTHEKMTTRDNYTTEEAESFYHNEYSETYQPYDGNDSVEFRDPPDIETILGSELSDWTIDEILERARDDARENLHREW